MTLHEVRSTRQLEIKELILKAWRERWTDVQWGTNAKRVLGTSSDLNDTFLAESILQQAMNGPGPNSLVLSYLSHSLFSQVISIQALLKSISQYDGYHKPFCVISLLNLIDHIKARTILHNLNEESCLELGVSLATIIYWLFTCMYCSLENLSDLSELVAENEDMKIVRSSVTLVKYFLSEPHTNGLIRVAVLEEPMLLHNIQQMKTDIEKFSDGHLKDEIRVVNCLLEKISCEIDAESVHSQFYSSIDGKAMTVANTSIQATLMTALCLNPSTNLSDMANKILILKKLKNMPNPELFHDLLHSSFIGLTDSVGTEHELKFIGFTFLQLPKLVALLRQHLEGDGDLKKGLQLFISNDPILDVADSKLHCSALELLLTSFQKSNLINENEQSVLLNRRTSPQFSAKTNSSNVVIILKAEATLLSVLKTLDGDYTKNQDAILSVLSDMLGKSLDLILTAASATGRLDRLVSRLLKLNQCSRQVVGEAGKASTTRAMIFDISFLMLCNIVQHFGPQVISCEQGRTFFEDWSVSCLPDKNVIKNPDSMVTRCDSVKVELLLGQYLSSESELKTSLVFWHELCTNSVGVVHDLLIAWENGAVNVNEVKKVLDVFRSKVCCLPVCISSWLCSYYQVMPEEKCTKAKLLLNHLLSPLSAEENQDKFAERHAIMTKIVNRMVNCNYESSLQADSAVKRKSNAELYKQCWKQISSTGLINVETTVNLDFLLEINGATQFVYTCVQEMMQLQHANELSEWRDTLFGIFHIKLEKCTEALISCVLRSCRHIATRDPNFVEPQMLALVTLTVDCLISYYYHVKDLMTKEDYSSKDLEDDEPQMKRRKLNGVSQKIEIMLKTLYDDFKAVICSKCEVGPQAVFILKFMEELAWKSPTPALLHILPREVVDRLLSVSTKIQPTLLLRLIDLSSRKGRLQCSRSICHLKQVQNTSNMV